MTGKVACRVGDTGSGFCNLHGVAYTTTFYESSSALTCGGIGVVLVGHHGHATCGHDTIAVSGSAATDVGGVAIHRAGDTGHIVGDATSTYVANLGSGAFDAS